MIFFKSTVSPDSDKKIIFEAIENDSIYATCTLILDGSKAEIVSLTCDESKPYIREGIIKSAFNYACIKNCYMGYINIKKEISPLCAKAFHEENGIYFNDIPTILQGNCCQK